MEEEKKEVEHQLNPTEKNPKYSGSIIMLYFCLWYLPTFANDKAPTLLKRINISPNEFNIRAEFMKWTRAGGKVSLGLIRRRKAEQHLYFNEL